MFAILGATGRVGWATIRALRKADQPVRAILRDPAKGAPFSEMGCEVAIADLSDVSTLARAFEGADFVQVICPPAPQAKDAKGEMRRTIAGVVAALAQARPQTVLAISDYGAEIESGTGITVIFHELEAALANVVERPIFLRSAEHVENWTRVVEAARETGRLPSLHHPLDKLFPTVSAHDIGAISAELLLLCQKGSVVPRVLHAEGPRRYTAIDVAKALTPLLGRDVAAVELPRAAWQQTLLGAGLSDSGAELVTALYDAHNRGLIDVEAGGEVMKGNTELAEALKYCRIAGHTNDPK